LHWDTELKGFALKLHLNTRGKIERSFLIQYRGASSNGN
jgi:hypothetical protein